jgi:hypothetical protein
MPTEDEMSVNERRKYLKRMHLRYVVAKRRERSQLLTEMEQVTGLHAPSLERKKRASPRARRYGLEVERVCHRAGVGEPRLHLCRTAHARSAADGPAARTL